MKNKGHLLVELAKMFPNARARCPLLFALSFKETGSYNPPHSICDKEGRWDRSAAAPCPAAVIVGRFCFFVVVVCVVVIVVFFLPYSLSLQFSGLAFAIRDQEYHGFLFANVSHDRRQLVDVAAVEMLRLPQVQDHRGWTRFGCKETHVSAEKQGGGGGRERERKTKITV